MIEFSEKALVLSTHVAKALWRFVENGEKPGHTVGIDDCDVCATDGQSAVRFQRIALQCSHAPRSFNGRGWARAYVEERFKNAGRGNVELSWELLGPGMTFPQLSKVEPPFGVKLVKSGDNLLTPMLSPSHLAKLEVVARACVTPPKPGKEWPLLPGAQILSMRGEEEPVRYGIALDRYSAIEHEAYVTIMPMRK